MATPVLLIVIYAAFISLGLPDSTLGVAWPAFRAAVGAPLEAAGLVAVVLTVCSAVSSLASGYVNRRLGTGRTVAISCVLTAMGLIGYSAAPSFFWVLVAALPLGFGQGAVDSSLNAFVAAHYSSRHMNWLHASWGIGATVGPIVMSRAIADYGSYRLGYRLLGGAQGLLAIIFIATLGLWKRPAQAALKAAEAETAGGRGEACGGSGESGSGGELSDDPARAGRSELAASGEPSPTLRHAGPWLQVAAYALYAACESSVGIWAASLLVEARGASPGLSGVLVAMYFGGIMTGRIAIGFVSDRLGNRLVVRLGLGVALLGGVLFALRGPLWLSAPGLLLLGIGFAPIYPGLMHETPKRFGGELYRTVIGFQMAAAMLGASIFPGIVGLAASALGLEVVGIAVIGFILTLAALIARLDATT